MSMTIFLYRWKIKPGKQKQFEDNWSLVTMAIREQCGSYGSRLHLAANGEYLGYAQWLIFLLASSVYSMILLWKLEPLCGTRLNFHTPTNA